MAESTGKIYVAGSLFTSAERGFLEQIDKICQESGYSTYLPHRDAGLSSDANSRERCFQMDKAALDEVVLLVAVLNGPDVDSGTAWEMGYAYARGIPVLSITDDKRLQQSPQSLNPMLYFTQKYCTSMEELRGELKRFLQTGSNAK